MVGALPDKFQIKMAYTSVLKWIKQVDPPFKLTDTLERETRRFDLEKLKEEDFELDLSDLSYSETIENSIESLTWIALKAMLEEDISPLLTARDLPKAITNIRERIKVLVKQKIRTIGPASRLKRVLDSYEYNWTMG